MYTEPTILQTLQLGIKTLLGDNTNAAPAHPEVYKAQLSLNFMSLFDSIIHHDWAELQYDHLHDKKLWTPQSNGTQWSVQVITFLWDTFLDLWATRNEVVHGSDEKARNVLKAERYKSILETMYQHKD
eukprot:1492752-Ditylum_brightwellii.AAC.1